LRSGAGSPLAGSLPVRLGLVHVVGYLLRGVRSRWAGTTAPAVMTAGGMAPVV